jgi:hypothetical protein
MGYLVGKPWHTTRTVAGLRPVWAVGPYSGNTNGSKKKKKKKKKVLEWTDLDTDSEIKTAGLKDISEVRPA